VRSLTVVLDKCSNQPRRTNSNPRRRVDWSSSGNISFDTESRPLEAQAADPRGPLVAEEVTPSFATRKVTNPFTAPWSINTFLASGFRGGEFRVVAALKSALIHHAISKHIFSSEIFV
jgi:hypothetical protein